MNNLRAGGDLAQLLAGMGGQRRPAVHLLFGLGDGAVPWIAAVQLFAIALAISATPVVYQLLEKLDGVLVAIVMVFLVIAIIIATDASSWVNIVAKAPEGVTKMPGYLTELGAATILGAVAFAGAGGANNLVQSNYVRDKGMGMGQRIPNIVSPITGEEEAVPSLGYAFRETEENARRWRGWWKVANQEQFITFFLLGLLTLIGLSVLVNSTIGIREQVGTELAFVQEEAQALGNIIGGWFRVFFLAAGVIMLFSTNLGIVDYTSRLTADTLKTGRLPVMGVIATFFVAFSLFLIYQLVTSGVGAI